MTTPRKIKFPDFTGEANLNFLAKVKEDHANIVFFSVPAIDITSIADALSKAEGEERKHLGKTVLAVAAKDREALSGKEFDNFFDRYSMVKLLEAGMIGMLFGTPVICDDHLPEADRFIKETSILLVEYE
jgi:hypothetical protein